MRLFAPSPNDGKPGEIHPIALTQLAIYQEVARKWTVYRDGRQIRCDVCDQAIYAVWDRQGLAYDYSPDEKLALTVAHIRQTHAEVIDSGIE